MAPCVVQHPCPHAHAGSLHHPCIPHSNACLQSKPGWLLSVCPRNAGHDDVGLAGWRPHVSQATRCWPGWPADVGQAGYRVLARLALAGAGQAGYRVLAWL